MNVAALIFSKNRAMQLDALLRSIGQFWPDCHPVYVLYHAEDAHAESYRTLKTDWPIVQFVQENVDYKQPFEKHLAIMLAWIQQEYVCLLVDDDLFYRDAPEPVFITPGPKDDSHYFTFSISLSRSMFPQLGYSFRLGENITECYNQPDKPRADFEYLFSLDGTIYPRQLIREWIGAIGHFANPNELEAKVNAMTGPAKSGQLRWAERSCLVNIPHNIVTTAWKNRSMGKSAYALSEAYQQGWRIDVPDTFAFVEVYATHQEIDYCFKTSAADGTQERGMELGHSKFLISKESPSPATERRQQSVVAALGLKRQKGQAPLFSICHPTARIANHGWFAAFSQAMRNADHPEQVEYILCLDCIQHEPACGPTVADHAGVAMLEHVPRPGDWVSFRNPAEGGHGCVIPNNLAAQKSTGAILINGQDDVFFPPHWDTELLKAIGTKNPLIDEFFIHVSSGGPSDDRLFAPQIYSRARYLKQGYAFPPEYESMYADDDLTERAYHDGIVIEARHLLFEQKHPAWKKGEWDEVYAIENASERYTTGKEILERRRKELGFSAADIPVVAKRNAKVKHIALCLPGEHISLAMRQHDFLILGGLMKKYSALTPVLNYSTNVYMTRAVIAECAQQLGADAMVWIDDDNPVTPDQIELLIADLEAQPELDGVAGWCYCATEPPAMSCGMLDERGFLKPFTEDILSQAAGDLIAIDYTGFPLFATRPDVYAKIGQFPFRAVQSDWFPYGQSGEDTSFCMRARNGQTRILFNGVESEIQGKGLKFAVDRRVQVPHLKTGVLKGPQLRVEAPPAERFEAVSQCPVNGSEKGE